MASMKDIVAWAESDGLLEPEDSENPQDGHKAAKKSQATALVELAGDLALWHTPDMEAFASVSLENRQVNWLLASKEFKRWLNSRYSRNKVKCPEPRPPKTHCQSWRDNRCSKDQNIGYPSGWPDTTEKSTSTSPMKTGKL